MARTFVYGNGIDEVLAMFLPEKSYDPDDVAMLIDFCDTWLADSEDGNYDSDYDFDNSGVVDMNDFAVLADDSWSLPTTTETRFYYLHDALGSVVGLVGGRFKRESDREFYLYDVYGATQEESACGNPYFFTGRRLDPESSLYYFRFRTYDPHTGRMLQTDPIGYYDSMNLYEYVTSNPTNWVDPYGLFERLSDARPWWKTGWNWLSPGDYFSRDNLRKMLERRRRQNEFDVAYRQAQREIAERRDNLKECLECIEIGVDLQIAVVMGTAQGVANVANGLQDSAIGLVNAVIWIGNNGPGTVQMAPPRTATLDNQVQLRYVDSRDWSYGLFMDESRLGHEVSKIVGAESAEFLAGVGMAKAFLIIKKGKNAKQLAGCIDEIAEQAAKNLDNAAKRTGGRLGNQGTRDYVGDVADELKRRGWDITGGGQKLPEEYLPGPGNVRKGSNYLDITATKNGKVLRVNTVDTLKDGITPNAREARAAVKIRGKKPNDHLLLIPKRKK